MLLSKLNYRFIQSKFFNLVQNERKHELKFQFGALTIILNETGEFTIANTKSSFKISADGHIAISAAHTIKLDAQDRIDLN
ncbi:MAG: hypothetical protein AB7F64_01815 [Gammaproteobacteria bacterium]